MKLALKLSLALAACLFVSAAEVAAADSPPGGARFSAVDGVARRAPRRGIRRRRGKLRVVPIRAYPLSPTPTPSVTEVDGAGLAKLLRRGGADGAKPLLVNFWATWCEPCRTEFPDLVRIDAEFRPRGLEFVVVSVDDVSEIKTGVPRFLRRMRAEMPAYLLNATDTDSAVTSVDPTWNGELPATFLYDREGKVVFKHTGIVKPVELRAALEKVLAGN
jgi:thiol-disulfide isomerase/thioredoxin